MVDLNLVRPYTQVDRAAAEALLGDARPLDAPESHVHVADDGIALWLDPPVGGDEPYLGPVLCPAGPGRRFYELVLACAKDALQRGYRRGYFKIKDPALLRVLQATFRIEPVAAGWLPESGRPAEWDVHVDLVDAIEQLRGVIQRLGGTA